MDTAGKIFVKTCLKAIRNLTTPKFKDKKEETIFYFFMVFNLLKIIDPFESKKHLRTQ